MTKWAVTNNIEYAPNGDTVALFSQKTRDEFILIYNLLNRLRTLDASSGTTADTEPYQLHIDTATKKLQMRNADNTGWIELGTVGENFFGLKPEDINAIKKGGLVGTIYDGNAADKPKTAKAHDLYFAIDEKKLYYFTGTAWEVFLSLDFKDMLNYGDCVVTEDEVAYNGADKILRLDDVTGKGRISITGTAEGLNGIFSDLDGVQDGQVLIYNAKQKKILPSTDINGSAKKIDGVGIYNADLQDGKGVAYDAKLNMLVADKNVYIPQSLQSTFATKTDLTNYTPTTTLNSQLSNYALTNDVTSSLASYEKTLTVDSKIASLESSVAVSLSSYETVADNNLKIAGLNSAVSTSLSAYSKTSDINSSLSAYAKESDVAVSLGSYVSETELNSTLASYVTESDLSSSLSGYVSSTDLKPYALTNDVASSLSSYAITSQLNSSLSNYVKTTDLASANVASAEQAKKLSTSRTIYITGGATGNANFDGSADTTINVSVNYAAVAGLATSATNATTAATCSGNSATATKAEQDSAGNNIQNTYATKTELDKLAAKVPSFSLSMSGNTLLISDGTNTYKFVGTVV